MDTNKYIVLQLVFLGLIVIYGCSSSSSSSDDAVINGRIQNIIQVNNNLNQDSIDKVFGFFTLTKIAYAQTANIIVNAIVDGEIVDSDETNSSGSFKLKVPEGKVTIQFETNPVLSFQISVIEKSDISLLVSLDLAQQQVNVNTFQMVTDTLSCKKDENFIYIEPLITEMTINGEGSSNCIKTKDDCFFNIEIGGRLNIINCDNGIISENTSEVDINPGETSSLNITSSLNGIVGTNKSIITIQGFDIDIIGGQIGIFADRNATISVSAPIIGECDIEGGDEALVVLDSAIVDIGECSLN